MAGHSLSAVLGDHGAFARADVAALYGDRGEGPAFLRALGAGNAVEMKSVVVSRGTKPVAAASLFWLPFDLVVDAPRLRPAISALRKVRAHTGYLRLSGLGGLHTGEPQIVISDTLEPAERDAAFEAMLDVAEAEGRRRRAHLHAVMEVSDDDAWVAPLMQARGYLPMEGVPIAWLHLPFARMEDYLASRTHKFRYNLKQTLARARAEIEVSETSVIDAALDAEIEALARAQQAHAKVGLGGAELMPEGFHRRLAELHKVNVLLYRLAGRLVGFGYMIEERDIAFGKTMGLSYPEARDYNLVHYNLYCSIEAAIHRGKKWLVLGQAGYPTKLRFGARLVRRTSYLKGRGIAGPLLPLVAGRLDDFSLARRWPETSDATNYFDADPSRERPPVKRIWRLTAASQS